MITNKIFQRSQRHEWVDDWSFNSEEERYWFGRNNMALLEAIKPKQTVTKRYVLDNQYWEASND